MSKFARRGPLDLMHGLPVARALRTAQLTLLVQHPHAGYRVAFAV